MPAEDEELAIFGPSGGGSCPVQYEADHAGVHDRHGWRDLAERGLTGR